MQFQFLKDSRGLKSKTHVHLIKHSLMKHLQREAGQAGEADQASLQAPVHGHGAPPLLP